MTYSVPYHCGNCGRHISIRFMKGEKAPEQVICTFCGCQGARKEVGGWALEVKPYTPPPTLPSPGWPKRGKTR